MRHLPDMVVFAEVVDAQGIGAGARHLGLTTSAVSRSIQRLEAHFGGQLLQRLHGGLSVTELGAVVYEACAAIARRTKEIEAAARHYASTPVGCLKVSAPFAYGHLYLAARLPAFMAAWPDLDVSISLTDRAVDPVRERFDVSIRVGRDMPLDAVSRLLQRTTHVLAASPAYLDREGIPLAPSDLDRHAMLLEQASAASAGLHLCRAGVRERVDPRRRLACDSGVGVIGAAVRGLGICLVPDYAVRTELAQSRLIRVLDDWVPESCQDVGVHATYSPIRPVQKKVRAFVDFLVAEHASDAS